MDNIMDIYEMFSGSVSIDRIEKAVELSSGDVNSAVEKLLDFQASVDAQKNEGESFNSQVATGKRRSDSETSGSSKSIPCSSNASDTKWSESSGHRRRRRSDDSLTLPPPFQEKGSKNALKKGRTSGRKTVLSQKEAIALVKSYANANDRVLVILRGCPGAGKSTLAKKLRLNGVILSTDEYFTLEGTDNSFAANLSKAREWNQERAEQAAVALKNPIIVDGINSQIGEMLPYASVASRFNYALEVIEPDVHWRLNADQLSKKNIHGVKKDKILNMLKEYDENISGDVLMSLVRDDVLFDDDGALKDHDDNTSDDVENISSFGTLGFCKNDQVEKAAVEPAEGFSNEFGDSLNISQTYPEDFDVRPSAVSDDNFMYQEGLAAYHHQNHHPQDYYYYYYQPEVGTGFSEYFYEPQIQNDQDSTWPGNFSVATPQLSTKNTTKDFSSCGLKPLVISPELGEQLLLLFGSPPNFRPSNFSHSIDLSIELAEMIHRAWVGGLSADDDDDDDDATPASTMTSEVDELQEFDSKKLMSSKVKLMRLKQRFPRIGQQTLEKVLQESGFKMDVAMKTIIHSVSSRELPFLPEKHQQTVGNVREAEAEAEVEADGVQDDQSTDHSNGQSHSDFVARIEHSQRMHKEFIGKTKDAFSRKNYSQASYYSTKAQEWKKQLIEDKEECATFLLQNKFRIACTSGHVDLHGLKVKEALDLVSSLLREYGPDLYLKRPHLFVITGCGQHSVGGKAKIKPCVEDFLKRNKYIFVNATPGILRVDLKSVSGLAKRA